MKKSQLISLVREVLQETIRKVDGKYVVYPEKGGKRLGTHSTRKAAEKQLTAIHLNKENYTATSPEQKINDLPKGKIFDDAKNIQGIFKKSKHSWSEVIEAFEKNRHKGEQENINLSDISITQPNIQSKKVNHIIKNINKSPIINVVEFTDGEKVIYDGHHRLAASWALGDTKIKVNLIQVEELEENYADGKVKGKSRPGRVKRAGASCKGSVTDLRAKAKKYGGEKGKMYHWCANMKGGKK
jgi:hypothetical protein